MLLEQIATRALSSPPKLAALSPRERLRAFYAQHDPKEVLLTSSFGTTAVYLLHLHYLESIRPTVYFLDTHYHFEETLRYRDELEKRFDFKVVNLVPEPADHAFTKRHQLWIGQADDCCFINKVQPLNRIRKHYKLWVSGLMRWQSPHRQNLQVIEQQGDVQKFYPLFDVTEAEVKAHTAAYDLPAHPLTAKGYSSVGCQQCTVKGKGREGRWAGSSKTECGLHYPPQKNT
jgi:phosphoadenosine phosphosulfate reductase